MGESIQKPLEYYRSNLNVTLSLLEAMRENGVPAIRYLELAEEEPRRVWQGCRLICFPAVDQAV